MEDAGVMALSIKNHAGVSVFGVFDGHGGECFSEYMANEIIAKLEAMDDVTDAKALSALVCNMDTEAIASMKYSTAGTTVLLCIVSEVDGCTWEVTTVNVGDSRAVVVRDNAEKYIVPLTVDHKPLVPEEKRRIENAGGFVLETNNRVCSILGLSRAIGDRPFKANAGLSQHEQMVIPHPTITKNVIHDGDVLVLMCDGLTEKCTNSDICDIVKKNMFIAREQEGISLSSHGVLTAMFQRSIDYKSHDNHTAILVEFKQGPMWAFKDAPKIEKKIS
jgi:protein phosphatase 1B